MDSAAKVQMEAVFASNQMGGEVINPVSSSLHAPDPAVLAVLSLCCRYELAYIETQGLARGQRVWQLAFGSGFKFNSAVLVANRGINEAHPAWDEFDREVR